VLNAAHMGMFSSDRTIRGYAKEVWGAQPAF
jgi:starch phosphorylase